MKLFGPSLWSRLGAFLWIRKYLADGTFAGVDRIEQPEPSRVYDGESVEIHINGQHVEGLKRLNVTFGLDEGRSFSDVRTAADTGFLRSAYDDAFKWRMALPLFASIPFVQIHHQLSPAAERITAAEKKRQRKRAARLAGRDSNPRVGRT